MTLHEDLLAIAMYRAMVKGVIMVACAGNKGPEPSSLYNNAPWLITVAVGSLVDPSFTTMQTHVNIKEVDHLL
jgi:hypothetical protein